jgi:hypothetical protein
MSPQRDNSPTGGLTLTVSIPDIAWNIDPLMVEREFCFLFLDNCVQGILSEGVLSRFFNGHET